MLARPLDLCQYEVLPLRPINQPPTSRRHCYNAPASFLIFDIQQAFSSRRMSHPPQAAACARLHHHSDHGRQHVHWPSHTPRLYTHQSDHYRPSSRTWTCCEYGLRLATDIQTKVMSNITGSEHHFISAWPGNCEHRPFKCASGGVQQY